MPELPEVETVVRQNRKRLLGRKITTLVGHWHRTISPTAQQVTACTAGQTIVDVTRRAKFVVLCLDRGGSLLIHLRMTGRIAWREPGSVDPPHVRAEIALDNGESLLFCDARKFGRITFEDSLSDASGRLGIEPLERSFTAARLEELLRGRARQLKPLLLDQRVVAGLGNIYADEALHRAGLHPLTRSDTLGPQQIQALHRAIRDVLRAAIRAEGTTFDWVYPGGRMQERLRVYGRADKPCRRCGTAITYMRVGQRGTHICPACQPAPPSSE